MEAKITEIGARNELIRELQELLGKLFYVAEESSLKHREHFIKKKGRDQPDLIIFNREFITIDEDLIKWDENRAIVAIIDTKVFNESIEKNEHFGQLYRYMTDLKARLGFLTNYKDVASHHFTVERLRKSTTCTDVKEVASWIVECIKEDISHIPMPLPVERIIETLDTSMNQLMSFVSQVDVNLWEDILRIKALEDEAVYKTDEEKEEARYRGAAFVALAQLLFFIVLRKSRVIAERNVNPKLRPLRITNGVPTQIQELLNEIRDEINYRAIYSYEIFPNLPDKAKDTLNQMIKSLEGLSSELVIQHDLLGLLFQRLIPFDLRKKLAAYYTKPLAAELLARLTIESGHETILDPACGSGTLLVQAYLQKKRILGDKAQHQKLLGEIIGSDISVFATILASVNLAIQDPELWTNLVGILTENAFSLPKAHIIKLIEQLANKEISFKEFTKQTTDGAETILKPGLQADIVIMNPPFTRGSRLTEDERKILLQVSKRYGLEHGWRDWNLYASFILLAPEFRMLRKKGRIGLVLPRAAIATRYMERVWKKIFKKTNLGVKYMINAPLKDPSFSDSKEQEMLVVMESGYKQNVKMIQLKEELENCDIQELAEKIMKVDERRFSIDYFEGQLIPQDELQAMSCREWSFAPPGLLELFQRDFVPIDILNFVITGGENASKPVDYFWLPNKYWSLVKDSDTTLTVEKTSQTRRLLLEEFPDENIPDVISIPKKFLTKSLVRRIRELDDQPPYLSKDFPFLYFLHYREFSQHLKEDYFKWGELFRKIVASWVFAPPRPANLFIRYKVTITACKTIAIRSPEALESTRFVSVIFIPANDSQETQENIDILFAYLTSSVFLLDYIKKSRVASGPFRRLYSTDLKTLMGFPNIPQFSKEQKKLIWDASNTHNKSISLENRASFAETISKARNKDSSSALRKLDETWFKVLNIPLNTLDALYDELLKEFSKYS
ncbi:N-6 DNA methylase [Candidatus Borrarchaeum sp.]|uniref:N-6 DNA methylase n=1 Tax=Candidatus Borrarchaeum sp. TaxID=2846742 RepID=UPI002579A4B9|nr:N-6 DNA methylase [Candidatus Borrarchaeum sp.]